MKKSQKLKRNFEKKVKNFTRNYEKIKKIINLTRNYEKKVKSHEKKSRV